MSVYEIVFSPTGGTKSVSKLFTEVICSERTVIDLCDREQDFSSMVFSIEDLCIVSVPSYGGRIPAVAGERIRQMKGGGARAVLIAVYGNRAYDDTLAELQDVLTEAGFACFAAVAAVAEHSIMRQFASGRPDAQDKEELAAFAAKIRMKLEDAAGALSLPGARPYREYGGVPMKPKAGKACTQCGLCAKSCPVGAILAAQPSETDGKRCISCMRCVAVCPQKARSVNKALLSAASFKLKKACSERKENELFL